MAARYDCNEQIPASSPHFSSCRCAALAISVTLTNVDISGHVCNLQRRHTATYRVGGAQKSRQPAGRMDFSTSHGRHPTVWEGSSGNGIDYAYYTSLSRCVFSTLIKQCLKIKRLVFSIASQISTKNPHSDPLYLCHATV